MAPESESGVEGGEKNDKVESKSGERVEKTGTPKSESGVGAENTKNPEWEFKKFKFRRRCR